MLEEITEAELGDFELEIQVTDLADNTIKAIFEYSVIGVLEEGGDSNSTLADTTSEDAATSTLNDESRTWVDTDEVDRLENASNAEEIKELKVLIDEVTNLGVIILEFN